MILASETASMLMAAMKSPGKSGLDPTWPSTSTVFQNRRAPPTLGVKLPNWPPFEAVPAGSLAGISPHGDMAGCPRPAGRARAMTSRPAIGILASYLVQEGGVGASVLMAGAWAEGTDSVDCPTVNRRLPRLSRSRSRGRCPPAGTSETRGFDGYRKWGLSAAKRTHPIPWWLSRAYPSSPRRSA
jgi:hypothetical protein